MGKLTYIAAAMQHLGRAFEEAGLGKPEVVVTPEDYDRIRHMTGSAEFMRYDAPSESKFAGLTLRRAREGRG